jgi:hypothetical protein
MSGMLGPNWAEDDAATFGEQVARCALARCRAPLVMVTSPVLVVFRCSMGHIAELHNIFAAGWWNEP